MLRVLHAHGSIFIALALAGAQQVSGVRNTHRGKAGVILGLYRDNGNRMETTI